MCISIRRVTISGANGGCRGLLILASISDAVVIVDVLSFSTAVDIAVSNRASVFPYAFSYHGRNESAEKFAISHGAMLASNRSQSGYSLSPSSLMSIPADTALVLPSPNGSSLSLRTGGIPTFTACLRNAPAVARRAAECGPRCAVIPAGERWEDESIRPCLEDLIGAGAVLAHLAGVMSPEAELAVTAFGHFRQNLWAAISRSGSGRELDHRGFSRDLELAAEFGVSSAAPFLAGDRYVNAGARPATVI